MLCLLLKCECLRWAVIGTRTMKSLTEQLWSFGSDPVTTDACGSGAYKA